MTKIVRHSSVPDDWTLVTLGPIPLANSCVLLRWLLLFLENEFLVVWVLRELERLKWTSNRIRENQLDIEFES